jgi:iron complex transport system substrate-binding protein
LVKPLLALVAAALLLPSLIAGCGSNDGGSSSSRESSNSAPLDLTRDDLGRSVAPPPTATKVVALSPSIVELMYAVGSTPIGRPASANYPDAARSVPSFGESRTPNLEEIARLQPDLIIADALLHRDMADSISSQLRVPVYAVKVSSFDDVTSSLRVVGALTGRKDAGTTAAADLEKRLDDIKAKLPGNGPSVLVLVAAGQNQFIAARSNTYLGDVLNQLGARNLVTTEPENFAYPGFTDYSLERIIDKNPDVVITVSIGGPPGTPRTSDILKSVPALASLKAVREGRVYEVDSFVYIQSAGPRVAQILDEMPPILYPNIFARAP